jgi:hypothetical protein
MTTSLTQVLQFMPHTNSELYFDEEADIFVMHTLQQAAKLPTHFLLTFFPGTTRELQLRVV